MRVAKTKVVVQRGGTEALISKVDAYSPCKYSAQYIIMADTGYLVDDLYYLCDLYYTLHILYILSV